MLRSEHITSRQDPHGGSLPRARPPRAADHGRRLPARSGLGRRGPAGDRRSAQLFGRPRHAGHPRREGPAPPRAGRPPLHLPDYGRAGNRASIGPQASRAHLLRRVPRARRRGPPRHVGYADARRAQATDEARRQCQGGGTLTMLALLLEGTLKGSLILALAGLLTGSMRGRSAAARHLVWCMALLATAALPLAAR